MSNQEFQAKQEFLKNQALGFFTAVRNLKVNLLIADMAGDLSDGFKEQLYGEFLQLAGLVEVKKQ